jgi:hypothetical protein
VHPSMRDLMIRCRTAQVSGEDSGPPLIPSGHGQERPGGMCCGRDLDPSGESARLTRAFGGRAND